MTSVVSFKLLRLFLISLLIIGAFILTQPSFAQTSRSLQRMDDEATEASDFKPKERMERLNQRVEKRQDTLQERMDQLKLRIATKEAALKEKLNKFRNKQKAQIAERINETLKNINEKITNAFRRHLQTLTNILDKLENRVSANKPDIKNPEAATAAINNAKSAIASASAAVEEQADKDYVVEATSEATIREDMKKVKEQLHSDLREVRELVIGARQAVANAIKVAKSNTGGQTN